MALRCGLDAEAWTTPRCAELTGRSYGVEEQNAGEPPPFDHGRALSLYRTLFGQLEDVIAGKSLLIVPSGALTQLPFQVLVTAASTGGEHRAAPWLIRHHALAVLPAVSSLKALRRVAQSSAATRPMIGFGNPLLDGDQEQPEYGAYFKGLAQLARDNQSCAVAPAGRQKIAALRGVARSLGQVEKQGGFADAAFLRLQAPLPDTADELCAVARDIGADAAEIRLGDRARERAVKQLSETGELARYRIVHFATHGALAGQLRGSAEPGLLLTPPDAASEEDDGYLTASEIAGLKLDADWVILSACNTAAGAAQGAEALSGLARAFIYAQARALLVSHWAVDSEATVKLITGAMGRLARDKSIGRAEAARQSMLAMIDEGAPHETHPSYWAPFVVVGEGAGAR
jgi:CHAT domain-containing protein